MDDFMDLMWLLKQFGPLLIAVIFFLWRDYRREDRLAARIETLEDEQREVLLPLVQKCSTVIAQNTVVMQLAIGIGRGDASKNVGLGL